MSVCIGICKEIKATEKRVTLIPSLVPKFKSLGLKFCIEKLAGCAAGFSDESYQAQTECHFVQTRHELLAKADIFLTLHPLPTSEIHQLKSGAIVIGQLNPYQNKAMVKELASRHITAFSLELIPRITRAQSMDILSSQATCTGYQSAIIAASLSPRFFPMLTTAAGTLRPAKVLIIGVGVAGLQAIATCKRLGAIVEAYDVRSATKEQAESLGARFIELSTKAEGKGGYARELTAEEKKQQQTELGQYLAKADVVITTAAVPGKKAPILITREMVDMMQPGAVIVDIAAEMGGNCELTQADKLIDHYGVKIYGAIDLPSHMAIHASEMLSKNIYQFLTLLVKDNKLSLDWNDQILKESAITHEGRILHAALEA